MDGTFHIFIRGPERVSNFHSSRKTTSTANDFHGFGTTLGNSMSAIVSSFHLF